MHDVMLEPTPRRLHWLENRWILELETLVHLGGGTFRPHTRAIEGEEAIVRLLAGSATHTPLAQSAGKLMRQLAGATTSELSFRAGADGWAPIDGNADLDRFRTQKVDAETLKERVDELEAEIFRLNDRIDDLATQLQHALARGVSGSAAPAPISVSPAAAAPSRSKPSAAKLDSTPAKPAKAKPTPAEAGSSPTPPASSSSVALPSASGIGDLLMQLLGDDIAPTECSAVGSGDLSEEPERYFVARLLDDSKAELGAFVLDLAGVVHAGGGLLMQELSERTEQISAGAPNAETLSAIAEVMSFLVSLFESGPRCAVAELKRSDHAPLPWLANARGVVGIEDRFGGRLWFAAR